MRYSTTPRRRGDITSGALKLVVVGTLGCLLLGMLLAWWLPKPGDLLVPEVKPKVVTKAVDGLAVGMKVEVVSLDVLCDTLAMHRSRRNGERPHGAKNGTDVFRVVPGASAEVVALEDDAVRLKITQGKAGGPGWYGRMGWTARDDVRKTGSNPDAKKGVAPGLDSDARHAVFRELHAVGMAATAKAKEKFPDDQAPAGADEAKGYFAERATFYEGIEAEGVAEVVARHKIDRATAQAIADEGFAQKWPTE